MNSVIFNGNKKYLGKTVKVEIENVNRNTLFGKIEEKREFLNWVILLKKNLNLI